MTLYTHYTHYNWDSEEFFENDHDPHLDYFHLIRQHAEQNYRQAINYGIDPLTAMDKGTDAAFVQAALDIDPSCCDDNDEAFSKLTCFWDLFRGKSTLCEETHDSLNPQIKLLTDTLTSKS